MSIVLKATFLHLYNALDTSSSMWICQGQTSLTTMYPQLEVGVRRQGQVFNDVLTGNSHSSALLNFFSFPEFSTSLYFTSHSNSYQYKRRIPSQYHSQLPLHTSFSSRLINNQLPYSLNNLFTKNNITNVYIKSVTRAQRFLANISLDYRIGNNVFDTQPTESTVT